VSSIHSEFFLSIIYNKTVLLWLKSRFPLVHFVALATAKKNGRQTNDRNKRRINNSESRSTHARAHTHTHTHYTHIHTHTHAYWRLYYIVKRASFTYYNIYIIRICVLHRSRVGIGLRRDTRAGTAYSRDSFKKLLETRRRLFERHSR